jgi:hypothetical protein
MTASPVLLGLVSDLFFMAPIETAARALGFQVQWIDRAEAVEPGVDARVRAPAEPLRGRGAQFIARVVELQPALILLDLSSKAIPWPEWIASLKSSPATRRIPVIAFGPHVDLELRQRAEQAGCDVVLAKSRFLHDLPALIQKHARRVDHATLADDCATPLSALALKGIELFNRQEFFEAHEELEHAWNEDLGLAKELYRGILQVAVAYLQITRGNYNGALKMFLRLRQWLDPLPDECRGVNVAQLRADALQARAALEALGPERIAEFDHALFKPVPMANS